MGNIELKIDPEELAQLKPYLEKNDFKGAYVLIHRSGTMTSRFTELFLQCGIDPLDYMTEVPGNYANYLEDYQFSLPNHIKKVGKYAFAHSGVYTANLENVELVNDGTFDQCEHLNTIKIGNRLQEIPYACFAGCISLKTVELPVNIKSIDRFAFLDCSNLSHVKIHNPSCYIEFDAFGSFKGCERDMLIEVRSEELANNFEKAGFDNVKIF